MRFIIVTGMSGAGKSTALDALEDADYYCVDNLPVQLIRPFAQIANDGTSLEYTKIAVGIDIRSGLSGDELVAAIDEIQAEGIEVEVLFLESPDNILLKRYKETRRTHPLSGKSGSVEAGIAEERKRISALKKRADYVIDTGKLLVRELKRELINIFVKDQTFKSLYITVQSFGFKYGIPVDSDLVVDVRFIPNPYYYDALRPLTGNDEEIRRFVMATTQANEFLKKYMDLLSMMIPYYITEGKNQLVISIGCTGGRHRSVVMTNEIAKHLSEDAGYGVRVEHRDLAKDPIRKAHGSEEN